MAGILSAVSSMVTSAISWVGDFAGLFTATAGEGGGLANPILLVPICLAVAGFGVGILKRLITVR